MTRPLNADEQAIVDALASALVTGSPTKFTPKQLAERLGWPVERVRATLAELERSGLVQR